MDSEVIDSDRYQLVSADLGKHDKKCENSSQLNNDVGSTTMIHEENRGKMTAGCGKIKSRRPHFSANEVLAIFARRPDVRNMLTGERMRRTFAAVSKQVVNS